MGKRHRPKVRKRARYGTGPGVDYRLECTCGHHTDWSPAPNAADVALAEHLEAVAVPESDRCREAKIHRTKWWEACPVCKFQLPIFDL